MEHLGYIIGISGFLAALFIVLWDKRRVKRTMDNIEQMLDAAADGTFTEKRFDESRLSALETRFFHYLSAQSVSSEKISSEQNRVSSLISDISHQTKTPIANLLLYIELLKEEEISESAKAKTEALYAQAQKLRFLIDSLVKLSRLENGILSLSPRQEKIQPMLENVAKQFCPAARSKGLALRMECGEITAVFDPKWTAEALCNIVDNAVKYTESGEITLSAVSYELFVRIDIADTGSGIPESDQAKIFSRFYRSENVNDNEGVGIGLYLAREIISGEGGYIKVASDSGEGTVFSVFLPK